MKKMNEKEMAALNAFLAEHVMGWKRVSGPLGITASTFFLERKRRSACSPS